MPDARTPFRIRQRLATALLTLSILPACAGTEPPRAMAVRLGVIEPAPKTEALAAPLAPARRPRAPLEGDIAALSLLTGAPIAISVERQGDAVRVRESDGCVWSRRGDWFTPSEAWSGCGAGANWRDGAAEVRQLASLWPMQVGAEGRWTREAVSGTGRRYQRDTTCRVVGAEAVIRPNAGSTPAFKVVCDDGGKRFRTTWYAPGIGPVAFVKRHAENGVEEAWVRS